MNKQQEKTPLTPDFIRFLKQSAHHLNPVMNFGKKGLNEPFLAELNLALENHELIKIKVAADHKEAFQEALPAILAACEAHYIASIGNIVILFRKNEEDSKFDC